MIAGASQGAALMPVMARAQTPAGTAPATINLPTVQALLASRQTWVAGTVIQVGSYFYRVPWRRMPPGMLPRRRGKGWRSSRTKAASGPSNSAPWPTIPRTMARWPVQVAPPTMARRSMLRRAWPARSGCRCACWGHYGFSTPLRLEDSGPNTRDNPGLQGAGWYKTFLVWRGGNDRAIVIGTGQGNVLSGFSLLCRPQAGPQDTANAGIFQDGLGSFCVRDQIVIDGFYRNAACQPGKQGLFQSQISNIRLFNTAAGDNLWTDSKGTANDIRLIYCSASKRAAVDFLLDITGQLQGSTGHIGLEHATVRRAAAHPSIRCAGDRFDQLRRAAGDRPGRVRWPDHRDGWPSTITELTLTNIGLGGWPVSNIQASADGALRMTLRDPLSEALAHGGNTLAVGATLRTESESGQEQDMVVAASDNEGVVLRPSGRRRGRWPCPPSSRRWERAAMRFP
jgi:hypothetical protein